MLGIRLTKLWKIKVENYWTKDEASSWENTYVWFADDNKWFVQSHSVQKGQEKEGVIPFGEQATAYQVSQLCNSQQKEKSKWPRNQVVLDVQVW